MLQNFKTYLFDKMGVDAIAYEQLEPYIKSRVVLKGEQLLIAGDVCKHTFYVEKGLLRLYGLDENGKENVLQFATENWLVSDRDSVYFKEPSIYYIDALEKTVVVLLDEEFIELLAELTPSFRKNNEKLLHNHIRHLNRRVHLLLGASAKTRYLEFVKMYPDVLLRAPQWMIASYLGITPESLSRIRKDLAKQNFTKY
ncbi:Crp/Fnr family transcriptional regulator [Cellulophaga fucicola]|uniref:cAMP-binding domain of CRP or a regulatory subunit of cAMP-dependent protein kinases n=1 Tax=Cellulophaga fucicola TaxID=76595 RepID=A0A1K1M846_9FLAO|nr:Crp/Fnr family transcriptional regulator [Cellulophaga fucicola]SFW19241.1 cAMP-binding domain of CRP or a regulatory subunit of cAMP-dependent protein kinases [Cellulophaga fucicola]